MKCTTCGSQLVAGGRACPNCGALVPEVYARAGASASDPTAMVASPPPSTISGSDPYNSVASTGPSGPYSGQANPYESVPPPPPVSMAYPLPVTPVRRKTSMGTIVGIGLLVLLLLGGGVFAYQKFLVAPGGAATTTVTGPAAVASTPLLSAAAAQKLYDQTTSGTPVINDPLTGADNNGWDDLSNQTTGCGFSGGKYHSHAAASYASYCYANATNFSNVLFQAQVSISNGHTGGLVFRANDKNLNAYAFRISTDGSYILGRVENNGAHLEPLFNGSSSPLITKGVNQSNLVAIIAQGNNIYVFVNKKYLRGASDSTYQSGHIGVYVDGDASPVDAAFSNVQAWQL
ncbi:MAG TPA: hypothetical protein VKR06_05100 [Ktedonosporobacter sp.]|nr:hypothetical protein [Ktedonosporobacter sp.]